MDFAPLMRGVKQLGYGIVEPCVDLDGSKNNHAFWPMTQIREKFAIIKEAGLEVISCHVAAENLGHSLPDKDFDMSNPADTDVCIGDGTLDNPAFMKWALSKGIPQYVDADTYTSVLDDAEKSLHYLESLI